MTIIDEILTCANQLANAGKKPTVALVKGKLSQTVPLATLITTLKNWQHQPDFITPINDKKQQVNQALSTNDTSALIDSLLKNGAIKKMIQQSLAQELTEMKNDLAEVKILILNLTEQLNQKR